MPKNSDDLEKELKALKSLGGTSVTGASDTSVTKALVTQGGEIREQDSKSTQWAQRNFWLGIAILVMTVVGVIVTWLRH